ncbi:hypothetical protein SDJN02_19743, partial [Cucurbita argyrosperma subsp. argyrosperma]
MGISQRSVSIGQYNRRALATIIRRVRQRLGVEDAISIGVKHLGEHTGVALTVIGDGQKVHGAGDSHHLLEGVGLENSSGVGVREVDGGEEAAMGGGGGGPGGAVPFSIKPCCIGENAAADSGGGRHSNISQEEEGARGRGDRSALFICSFR